MATSTRSRSTQPRLPEHLRGRDLTTGEVAEALGVHSINTVKNWVRAGYIREVIQLPSGQVRIPAREVERVLVHEMRIKRTPDVGGDLTDDELNGLRR